MLGCLFCVLDVVFGFRLRVWCFAVSGFGFTTLTCVLLVFDVVLFGFGFCGVDC